MKSQLQHLPAALGATFLLAGCIKIPENVTVNVNVAGPDQTGATAAAAAEASPGDCPNVVVEPGSTDTHIVAGQEFKVTGPDHSGDYRLHPIRVTGKPDHQLLIKPHPMLHANNTGHDFTGVFEVKGGPHGNVTTHLYEVALQFDTSGCASHAEFETMKHTDASGGPDHGGHAVAD